MKKGVFVGLKRAEFRQADEIGSCQRLAIICCIVVMSSNSYCFVMLLRRDVRQRIFHLDFQIEGVVKISVKPVCFKFEFQFRNGQFPGTPDIPTSCSTTVYPTPQRRMSIRVSRFSVPRLLLSLDTSFLSN